MGSPIPSLTESQFGDRLLAQSPSIDPEAVLALYAHYLELQRWNPRLSLVGPGTAGEILGRHYGESLAALPLIPPDARNLVDLGSGAGFPGLVLAAARPSLEVTLVEPRERKWAFLKTAVRLCGLSCRCLDVRVERPLPRGFPREIEVFTCRALALSPGHLEALLESSPRARFLFWCGAKSPELPEGCRIGRAVELAGSRRRRILEVCAT
ncbi:MAG: hypothetical protein GY719_11970 [bacterium]|nr:hypothetical protein [bacterium]